MAVLSVQQMKHGIVRLEKLIDEVEAFDPQILQKRFGPEVQALEVAIEGTLASVFGHKTVEYNRYKDAADLDKGPVIMRVEASWISARGGGGVHHDDAREAQQYVAEGKTRCLKLLRQAISWLQDELVQHEQAAPIAELNSGGQTCIHPQIQTKCGALYTAGAFAEAVEKSFKVVRDRLRELTGYEKGSDAFGKGKLHILGAVAPHVDSDFNEGAKFLMMAIDMFRNEKSHTSDAKITDPVRAQQYLTISSLAMYLLDNAELCP
jgi:uncharacterized protein (TIGR02391 family)